MSVTAEQCLLLSAQMHSGLCTLIGVREKPGGREKANRGKKEREGGEGEEDKEKRKRKRKRKEEKKIHQASTGLRLCQDKKSLPQAIPEASLFLGALYYAQKKKVALCVLLVTGVRGACLR